MNGSEDARRETTAYVIAAAALARMPLTDERLAAVTSIVERLRLFAADVADVDIPPSADVAEVFLPW